MVQHTGGMKGRCQWILTLGKGCVAACLLLGGMMHPSALLALDPYYPQPPERKPELPLPPSDADWKRRVGEQEQQLANQTARVCFLGDSLTEFWLHTGSSAWYSKMVPRKPLNLGIAGDRTENILFRIQRLDFRRARTELLFLMMGTNNLGMDKPDPPEKVVQAIQKAVTMLKPKLPPQAAIVVLGIPPSGETPRSPLRQSIQAVNTQLAAVPWPAGVKYVPVYDVFVDANDRWKLGLTLDGTHFSAAGYEELAKVLRPLLPGVEKEKPGSEVDPFGGKKKR